MIIPVDALSLEEGRSRMERDKELERVKESECRPDFLVNPEHLDECVCLPPCCRDYDPMPYPEAEPFPSDMYVGTGIAALYGGPMTARLAVELAGWNITPGRYPE